VVTRNRRLDGVRRRWRDHTTRDSPSNAHREDWPRSHTRLHGYVFGLLHVLPGGVYARANYKRAFAAAFVRPQTLDGLYFGWLYLRLGLEASIIAHAAFDLTTLIIATAIFRHVGFPA
jgi:hypothetical protein